MQPVLVGDKGRMYKLTSFIKRSKLTVILPVIISASLMAWLLMRIDVVKIIDRWQSVNWLVLALMLPPISLLNSSIRAGRVRLILDAQGIRFPYRWLWLLQLRGAFILSFIPGKVSGDLYRGYAIGRDADRRFDSITSVLLERVIGLTALIFVSVTSLFLAVYALDVTTYATVLQPVIFLAVAVTVAALLAFIIIRQRLIQRWELPVPLWNRIQQLAEQLYLLFDDIGILGGLGFLSVLLQLAVISWYFVIARAMHLDVSLLTLMVSVPVVELLVTAPISIGGIGVRESAMVFLLLPFGVAPEDAVSLSLLVAITATIAGTLAGLSFFVALPKQASTQQPVLEQQTERL